MHSDMGLQFPLDIQDDMFDVSDASFLDILGNMMALKSVLQISLLNQECNFDWGMRGFVEGMTKIQPTIRFIGSVLQRDSSCNPTEGECEMLPAGLAVDPLLFRRYGIDRVPAVVYARGVKAEDAALSEGDSKNTSIGENHTVYGDARLEYLIEQIQRETGARSLQDHSGI